MQASQWSPFNLTLNWQSAVALHCDQVHVPLLDRRSHILPANLQTLMQLASGESYTWHFAPGTLVPAQEAGHLKVLEQEDFGPLPRQHPFTPRRGRFYPQACASQALGVGTDHFQPLRITGKTATHLSVDTSHPLARYGIELTAHCVQQGLTTASAPNRGEKLLDTVTGQGPGMQAPYPGIATDFYSTYPFTRQDTQTDAQFYHAPRLVQHMDTTAIAEVTALYRRLLQPGMCVLDLMASWVSHLPADLSDLHVTGLGMNPDELRANPRLSLAVVHDLNLQPVLPFADQRFDAVVCTVSVEYLTQPLAVMRELARVTRPGGVVVMTFSTRWFPPKVIDLWSELHPFERQGLVLDYYVQTGCFADLNTFSTRGLPRPANDPHYRTRKLSDPVFAVWAKVTGGQHGPTRLASS